MNDRMKGGSEDRQDRKSKSSKSSSSSSSSSSNNNSNNGSSSWSELIRVSGTVHCCAGVDAVDAERRDDGRCVHGNGT